MRRFRLREETKLEKLIDDVETQMQSVSVNSQEYKDCLEVLVRLYAFQKANRRESVSPDTIAIVCANLMGILMIIAYEQRHVISSKGWTHLPKIRTPMMQ